MQKPFGSFVVMFFGRRDGPKNNDMPTPVCITVKKKENMGKSKEFVLTNDDAPKNKDSVRTWSFIIIGACIALLVGLLGLMVWRASNNNPEINRVIITTDILPDSLKAYNYITQEQVDSLINTVKAYDDQLIQKYQYLVEQKEQDTQVFYWGSLIVGIVVSVFGWFGFQSFTTIEDKAKSKAANVATRTAWTATQKFLKDEGKTQISEAAKSAFQDEAIKNVKEQVLSNLNTTIENRMGQYMPTSKYDELDKRIETLEGSMQSNIDKAVKEAVKEAIEKYKRSSKGVSKDKEGQ